MPGTVSTARRDDALFRRYPATGSYVTSHGVTVPTPFHAYDADGTVVYGTARLDSLERLAQGSGYRPVSTTEGRGFASLWFVRYADSCIGPYTETVIMTPAARTSLTVPWKNELTPVAPTFLPGTLLLSLRLLLPGDNIVAIDYGRELNGLDKHPASHMDFQVDGARYSYAIHEGGRLAVRFQFTEDRSLSGQLKAASALAANIGTGRLVSNALRRWLDLDVVSVLPGFQDKVTHGHLKSTPRFTRVEPSAIEFGDTAYGTLLRELSFVPTVASHDAHLEFVLEAAR